MHRPRQTPSDDVEPEVASDRVGPTILDLRNPPTQEARPLPESPLPEGPKPPAREPTRSQPSPVPTDAQPAPDRWTLLWRAKIWIALATVAAGTGAYFASSRITPSYQASSLVQVSAHPQAGISPQDIASASNELAAQLAQLARTAPVVALAAQSLHDSAGAVGQHVVAAVLANQNLIQITAQNSTPKSAQARATAMAEALQGYVSTQGASAPGPADVAQTNAQLAAIDTQLAAAQADAAKAEAAAAGSFPGTVTIAIAAQKAGFVAQLQLQRNTVALQLATAQATADATTKPTVRALGEASGAVKVQPRPTLYAGVTLVMAALLAGQIAVFAGSRRHLDHRATSDSGQ